MFLELNIDLRAKTKTNTEIDVQCISFCVCKNVQTMKTATKKIVGIAVAFNRKRPQQDPIHRTFNFKDPQPKTKYHTYQNVCK